MTHIRKPPVSGPSIDWGPWTNARFQTVDGRDGFVLAVATMQDSGWGVESLPDDCLGAKVRWRPGRFLRLNDIAYAHGGRIARTVAQHRIV